MVRVRVNTSSKDYQIEIETGLFKQLPQLFKSRYQGRRLALISDDRVFGLYGRSFVQELEQQGLETVTFVFPEGEQQKNLESLKGIYQVLAEASFTRSDYVVALGGGVTGDMAGLAAATFAGSGLYPDTHVTIGNGGQQHRRRLQLIWNRKESYRCLLSARRGLYGPESSDYSG